MRWLIVANIDLNKTNNNVSNLRIVTQRLNTSKKHIKSTSSFVGVCWNKNAKKWISQIWKNNKKVNLGYFSSEIEAHKAYENALSQIQ